MIVRSLIIFLMTGPFAFAEVSLETVLASTRTHSPAILSSLQSIEAESQTLQQDKGAFDTQLNANINKRTRGFFDGEYLDARIEKPLPFFNSKVYGGYRLSAGTLPSYEGKQSAAEGEPILGLSFSLLRNRDIDKNRLKIKNQKLQTSLSRAELRSIQLELQKQASIAYWTWIASGEALTVYRNLHKIAIQRNGALSVRFKNGDLAKIYLDENRRSIYKRQADILRAEQGLLQASLNLSLFLRNKEGHPLVPGVQDLPKVALLSTIKELKPRMADMEKIATRHPVLNTYQMEIKKQENKRSFAKNRRLPKLDLNVEASRDQDQEEHRVSLSLNIPLEQKKIRGQIGQANSEIQSLKYKYQLAFEKLRVKLRGLVQEMHTLKRVVQNLLDEVSIAKKLEKAEFDRFMSGASDFFLVTLREQNTADAQLRYIKTLLELHKAKAYYKQMALEFLTD